MLRAVASGRKRSLASIYRAAVVGEGGGGGGSRQQAARAAAATEGVAGVGIVGDEAPSALPHQQQQPLLPFPLPPTAASGWTRPWRHHPYSSSDEEEMGWWQQRHHGRRRGFASSSAADGGGRGSSSSNTRLEASAAAQPERVSEPSPSSSSSGGKAASTPKAKPPPPPPSPSSAAAAAAAADKRAERAAVVAAHRLRMQQQHQQQLDADLAAARLQLQQRQQLLRNVAAGPASSSPAAAAEEAPAAPATAAAEADASTQQQQQQQQQPRPAQQLCRIVQYVRSGVEVSLRVTTTPGAAPYAGVDASAAAANRAAAARLQQQQQQQQQQQSPNDYILEWSRRSIPSAEALGKRERQQRESGQGAAADATATPVAPAAAAAGNALSRLRERGAQAALRAKKMLQQTFLPAGYPSSVGSGYVEFAAWQAVTNLATTANGVLASTFLLYSVGLGAGAIPTAGALNWVLKDGLGQVGTLLFGKAVAHNFDIHSKTWYFLSLVLLAGATGLEIATFVAPGAFLALGSAANAIKGLSWMAGGSTRSVFNLSFARDNNIADITAKGTSQYIFASLFGTTAGVSIAAYVGQSPAAAAAAFGALSALSLYGGFRTVKSIPLPTLNSTRLQLLAARYLKCIREGGDTARSVAAAEAAIAGGAVAAGAAGGGLGFLRGGGNGGGAGRGGGAASGGRSKPRFSDFHDEDDVPQRPSGGGLSSSSGSRRGYKDAGAPRAAAVSASGDADPSGGSNGGKSSGHEDDEDDDDDGGACGLGPAPIEMSASAMRSRRAALVAAVQRRRAAVLNSSNGRASSQPSPLSSSPPPLSQPPLPGAGDAEFVIPPLSDDSNTTTSSTPHYYSYGHGQAYGQRGDDYQREYRLPDEDDDSCELGLPSPQELAAVDPPLPWLMGDQRILNPAIRVGTALDALVGGSPALLLVLMSTFRYEKALVVPGNAAAVANAAAAGGGGGGGGLGGGASSSSPPRGGWSSSAAAAPGDVHVVLHADAQGPDIVQAYLQACILRKRLRRGATVAPGDLAALRLVLHDTLLASKRLAPSFMRALERQGWMTDKIVVEAHRRRARW